MFDPKYIEVQINNELAKRDEQVHVTWNGEEDPDNSAFDVFLYGDDTPFFVQDIGGAFEVIEYRGDRHYTYVGTASNYSELAEVILSNIEDAVLDGTIVVEEL